MSVHVERAADWYRHCNGCKRCVFGCAPTACDEGKRLWRRRFEDYVPLAKPGGKR